MRKTLLTFMVLLLIVSGCLLSGPEESVSEGVIKRFAEEIDCSDGSTDPYNHWCAVEHIGEFSLVLPEEVQTYLGFSVALSDDESVRDAIDTNTHVAALHIGPDTARLTALIGTTDQDNEQLDSIAAFLTGALQGIGGQLNVPEDLIAYLESEREFPGYTMSKLDDVSAVYNAELPYTVYYITDQFYGDAYLVIEDAIGGLYVSVFPAVAVM